jgi:hypothetical protein
MIEFDRAEAKDRNGVNANGVWCARWQEVGEPGRLARIFHGN